MKKVFVGGSRQLGSLNEVVRRRLDNIMAKSFGILVGDANGVDKAVQKHCASRNFDKVVVFCAGDLCRNNLGNWETRHIVADRGTRDYKFYMIKDLQMVKEADYGFMIWDAKSSGTFSNILELLEMGKKVLVYVGTLGDFVKLQSTAELHSILRNCPEESIRTFENKFHLSKRLRSTPDQLQMFS